MAPKVDLVVVFRSGAGKVLSKQQARENARDAAQQYTRLLDVLRTGRLKAVGKRGEREGQLLVLLSCPEKMLKRLALRERHSDFLSGLPTSNPIAAKDLDSTSLCPADRLRLVHAYVTCDRSDGGLGVSPESKEWKRIESVLALHDKAFNDAWIRSWTTRQLGFVKFDKIKEQFGEAVALYFHFLSCYTKFLIFISGVGALFYFYSPPYSSFYSTLLLLWSITFVEFWRIKQRILSVRWGTRGSLRVEKRRPHYAPVAWWKRDLRMIASLPVILLFAAILGVLLTGIFVLEAFVTHLYKGPGHRFISFSPTILFSLLVPRILSIYHSYAMRLTNWENHRRQSSYDASLTIKTFALSGIEAYLGLALSAFVYVPFGEQLMTFVQQYIFQRGPASSDDLKGWATSILSMSTFASEPTVATSAAARAGQPHKNATAEKFWEMDGMSARSKLNPSRLQDQMFAFTVTNQVVNTFMEIGLPYVMRAVDSVRSGRGLSFAAKPPSASGGSGGGSGKKKRVMFEDEASEPGSDVKKDANGREEREFMESVRRQVALPEYNLFEDYREMVTQFGYVALWSTIWPLAPVMSLINNWLEMRSDAFKIAVHVRRPIPSRTDTIGPWLDALTFLTWLAALTNSALVYLFRPTDHCKPVDTMLRRDHERSLPDLLPPVGAHSQAMAKRELLVSAVLVALAASHGYMLLRVLVRHVLERALWKESPEEKEVERLEWEVKEEYLRSLGVADVRAATPDVGGVGGEAANGGEEGDDGAFWAYDEGLDELQDRVKDA